MGQCIGSLPNCLIGPLLLYFDQSYPRARFSPSSNPFIKLRLEEPPWQHITTNAAADVVSSTTSR
jgi:hypothetical protein